MINKIIIDNFMAHEHTELELGPGVTILTGSNNTGKSAVVEALRCLATNPDRNPNPSLYIRHGAKEARVEVVLDDGTRVAWVRAKRWAKYELWAPGAEEPEEYHKLQRQVPEDVARVLRLDQVALETRKDGVDVHIGNQRDPVFLLNQPDSVMAEFFAASTESAHLLAMQNLLKLKERDAKREERGLEEQAARAEAKLDRLDPLPAIGLRMDGAGDLEREADRLEREIPALEAALAEFRHLTGSVRRARAAGAVLEKTAPVPEIEDVAGLKARMDALQGLSRRIGRAVDTAGALSGLSEPPAVEDTGSLQGAVRGLAETGRVLRGAEVRSRALADLAEPPQCEDTARLAALLDEWYALRARDARFARLDQLLRSVAEPPSPEPLDRLRGAVADMDGLAALLTARQGELSGLEEDLRSVVDAMDERIRALGCCPLCGGDLTTAEFLDHGCRHDA
ncbi:MAG: AAA family ATPase [Pseudodesulfovibrio sp.]|uniref:AAA family ATPase n=1 Tax=Pseudodesulfovibrio sp. TaxID=2035812 RepID=UPI003D13A4DC